MLEIVLCDDNEEYLAIEERLIDEFCEGSGIMRRILKFTSATEMIKMIRKKLIKPHVVFLDLEMKPLSGIQAAEKINERLPDVQIVFVSGYMHYITDVYETNHIYYVLKDELEVKLGQVFGKILQSVAMEDEQLVVERRGICKVIKQYRVAFLERDGRKTKMVLVDGLLETNEKLDDVCKKLSEQMFVRCHNSFAVNLFQVQEYHRDAFIMKNGEAIPISRRYMQKVRIKFLEWAQLYQ